MHSHELRVHIAFRHISALASELITLVTDSVLMVLLIIYCNPSIKLGTIISGPVVKSYLEFQLSSISIKIQQTYVFTQSGSFELKYDCIPAYSHIKFSV